MGIKFLKNELTLDDLATFNLVDFTNNEESIEEVLFQTATTRTRSYSNALLMVAGLTLFFNDADAKNMNLTFAPSKETKFTVPFGENIFNVNTSESHVLATPYEVVKCDDTKTYSVDIISIATNIFSDSKPLEGEDLQLMNEFTDKIIAPSGKLKRK